MRTRLQPLPDGDEGVMTLTVHAKMEQREEWRAIPGHEGYEVSDLGRVRSYRAHGGNRGGLLVEKPRIKAAYRHNTGYLTVVLQADLGKSQPYAVHRLVASAFLGPRPSGKQVAHRDGDRMNAQLDNLRYATPLENAQDKRIHGTDTPGERNGTHKLTEVEVRQIRARYEAGERQKDLALAYGVCQQSISNVVRRIHWTHIDEAAS
jgi:hypothetical protein